MEMTGKDHLLHQKLANEIGICVIKIQRQENDDLGFTLDFKEDSGTYVKQVREGSKLHEEGLLKTGDRLIWVNRTNVESMSLEEVNAVLDMAPDGSSLVISRNKDQQKEVETKKDQPKEAQLIPNVLRSEEPYLFGVTYLT